MLPVLLVMDDEVVRSRHMNDDVWGTLEPIFHAYPGRVFRSRELGELAGLKGTRPGFSAGQSVAAAVRRGEPGISKCGESRYRYDPPRTPAYQDSAIAAAVAAVLPAALSAALRDLGIEPPAPRRTDFTFRVTVETVPGADVPRPGAVAGSMQRSCDDSPPPFASWKIAEIRPVPEQES